MSAVPAATRRRYNHGDLRRSLVEAATALVESEGASGFTLREAARRAGVNHRAAYRHFRSKEALAAAVAEWGFDRMRAGMQRRLRGAATPSARVGAILRAYVRFALGRPSLYRAMFGPSSPGVGVTPELRRAAFRVIALIEPEAESILGAKGRPVRDAVIAQWAMAHGLCELMIAGHIPYASIRRAEDYVLERLAADPLPL